MTDVLYICNCNSQKSINMLFNIIEPIAPDNYVAFTFFTGYIAMLAASVFFFVERGSVSPKWKMSLLVSALITGIAAVHYYYMRDYNLATGDSPTFFRYVDWILTVPLMCGHPGRRLWLGEWAAHLGTSRGLG